MTSSRISREGRTVAAMISIYCQGVHHAGALCTDCVELKEYALLRLEKCPFQAAKPTCVRCAVHCYRPSTREKIRQVMRYAGPRMIYRRPGMALIHIIDGWRGRLKPPYDASVKKQR